MANSLIWYWILTIVGIILIVFLLSNVNGCGNLSNKEPPAPTAEEQSQNVLFSWEYDMTNSPNTNVNNINFELELWYPGTSIEQPPDEKIDIPSNSYVSGYPKEISVDVYQYEWYYMESIQIGTYQYQLYAYITTIDGSNLPSGPSPDPPGTFTTVLKCDPANCNPGITYCDAPDCKSCECQCGLLRPDISCNNCTSCDVVPNRIYANDPISQAIYYGFCRYADNVSKCMQDSSKRYGDGGAPLGVFPPNLPNSTCYPISQGKGNVLACSSQCPPFSTRVKSSDGKTVYASCVSPYNSTPFTYAYNPVYNRAVPFDDWTSNTNAYKNGFIWTTDEEATTCVVPLRNNSPNKQTRAMFVERYVLSGHPYLIWNTRYSDSSGNNQVPYSFFTGGTGSGYPLFRIYHPASRTVISNDNVHAPNSGKCSNDHMSLKRVTNPDTASFYCKPTGDNSNDEKCYLFSMWNQCGSLGNDSADILNIGDPMGNCYNVWNMPVKNGKHRQMIVESPPRWVGNSNPDTCLEGTAQRYYAVAVSGTTAEDPSFTFDFYANANLSWPPTSNTNPWVQPLQYCIPMSSGTEYYYNCNMYMYTFADTDSSNPSSYETIGWYSYGGNTGKQQGFITSPPGDASDTKLSTTYISNGNYSLKYQLSEIMQYSFNFGSEYTDYTNIDDNKNVYEVTLGFDQQTINITDTGLIKSYNNGVTYYLCTYSYGSTKLMLWINLDGNFTFNESVTIRCPMWAVYYSS